VAKVHEAIGWSSTRKLEEILGDVIQFHQAEASVV